jgi:hypothetical protein
MSLKIIKLNLEINKVDKLKKLLQLYIKAYPNYENWKYKRDYFNEENTLRSLPYLYETSNENKYIGYLKNSNNKIILDERFIKFMLLRFNGLQQAICDFEYYLKNNKYRDTCKQQKNLEFFKRELEKLKPLISEYKNDQHIIDSNIDVRIGFVKKICETISWGFEEINDTCKDILLRNDLHPKTYGAFKQRVLGTNASDRLIFVKCNKYFLGKKIKKLLGSEDKTIVWTIFLNKFAILAPYYCKAPFIRFILKNRTMPYRNYQPVNPCYNKGEKIAELEIGPYKFDIHDKSDNSRLTYSNDFLEYTLYDDKNYVIWPPLLRATITITYTEFRDLLCYLNLPVFRSTKNINMLFFPNYDLHQRLLEIQGFPRNYCTYDGKNIDWKWFNKDEIEAKKAISSFCKEYEESIDYGIVPVEYVWYDIVYPDSGNIKKFIFLVVTLEELIHYTDSDIYKRDGKYYICNKNEVAEHMVSELNTQKRLEHVDYIWYNKYLFLVIPSTEAKEYKKKITAFQNKEQKIYYSTNPYSEYVAPWIGLTKVEQISYNKKYLKYKIKYLNLKKTFTKNE